MLSTANGPEPRFRPIMEPGMTSLKSRTVTSAMTDQANAAIESALRTFEAEAGGVTALAAALKSDLGPAFVAAADNDP